MGATDGGDGFDGRDAEAGLDVLKREPGDVEAGHEVRLIEGGESFTIGSQSTSEVRGRAVNADRRKSVGDAAAAVPNAPVYQRIPLASASLALALRIHQCSCDYTNQPSAKAHLTTVQAKRIGDLTDVLALVYEARNIGVVL